MTSTPSNSPSPPLSPKNRKDSRPRCPICKTRFDRDADTFPFCSKRCRTIDLAKWIDGDYKITRPLETRDLEEGID